MAASDNQGSRPGQTFQAMREKARAGKLAGPSNYATDCSHPQKSGYMNPPNVGQAKSMTTSKLGSKLTGNNPWERARPLKPGA